MEIKGDFLGFSYGNKRSEELGIVRVSDGDRYDEDLQPEINDIVAEVPGKDGAYYFGSTFGKRTISISFAFDSMTEEQFRQLRKVFGRRHQNELIFDERPYKKYIAKVESPIELSYVCFDEPKKEETEIFGIGNVNHTVLRSTGNIERIYKGDGKIDFVCYFPFAKSCFKVLDTDELKNSDWAVSSGILTDEEYESVDTYEDGHITVYNPGDVATGFRLYVPMSAASQGFALSYHHSEALSGDVIPQLVINSVEAKPYDKNGNELIYDTGILIDTNNGLIIGVKTIDTDDNGNAIYETSGNLYNDFIESGYFFKFQPDERNERSILTAENLDGCQIFYDYLYF